MKPNGNGYGNKTEVVKSRVAKIDSEKSWDLFIARSSDQGYPVMVQFTAEWCMPSVGMHRFFEDLSMTYQDVVFLSVDVDEVKVVASKMEIKAMPTFILMREGALVDKLVGANPREVSKMIQAFTLGSPTKPKTS